MGLLRLKDLFVWMPFPAIYCNRDIMQPLIGSFMALEREGLNDELRSYGGCWNIRPVRGGNSLSLHSWGVAVDFNTFDNPLGLTREQATAKGLTPFTDRFQQVWRDHGWTCGIDFARKDGMHFEYTKHLLHDTRIIT